MPDESIRFPHRPTSRIQAQLLALALLLAALAGAPFHVLAQTGRPPVAGQAARVVLVSPAEVAQYKADFFEPLMIPLTRDGTLIRGGSATSRSAPSSAAGEPLIEVVRPKIADEVLRSPVAIEVRFKAIDDAQIDPGTFQVFYGLLRIDVTSRLFKTVTVTPQGFKLDQVDVPPGSHRLVMRVTDDKGRTGVKEIKFTVGG